ncbi:MAG: Gfo/Idh/MocA family oxidoreductase [SAR324 cluster bacterium]|nr:Gfo/Idh/MocA family oxidoreductase [SAR324 cluster bacterium]
MNQNIRTGLIGLGRIGWNFHACEIDKHEYFDLISVSDLRNDFLEEGISKYHCKGYSNYQEMIDNDALDLVVIATPTILHYPMLISCLESGKNVICEKPLVLNYKEALHIKEISIKNNCILTTYQPRRLSGYFQNILSLIENDQIGDVFWVHFSDFRYSIRNDWQSLKKYGGGMLRNYGAHFIDQMLKIIGYDIKDISCLLVKNITLGDAEDLVKIICVTTNNVIGEITINQGSPINPYELIVWGKQGTITYHNDKIKLTEYDPNSIKIQKLDHNLFSENRKFPFHELDINTREIKVNQGDGINLYDDFARAFYKKEQPTVKIDETLEVVKFIDECFATTSNES